MKRYIPEETIRKLREADVLIGQGQTIATVLRTVDVTDVTYYRWRKNTALEEVTRENF